jgi:hypothetical protein
MQVGTGCLRKTFDGFGPEARAHAIDAAQRVIHDGFLQAA